MHVYATCALKTLKIFKKMLLVFLYIFKIFSVGLLNLKLAASLRISLLNKCRDADFKMEKYHGFLESKEKQSYMRWNMVNQI